MTKRIQSKWVYIVNEDKNYKQILTNKKSCPVCGEYRKIERVVTFIMQMGVGLMKPYRCKSCGFGMILVGTGDLLDHINEVGRNYPIDRGIYPDIPLFGDPENQNPSSLQTLGDTET